MTKTNADPVPADVVLLDTWEHPLIHRALAVTVNGEPCELVGVALNRDNQVLVVSVRVNRDRVQVDEDARQLTLDGRAVPIEQYGYRRMGDKVQLDIQVHSLTTGTGASSAVPGLEDK